MKGEARNLSLEILGPGGIRPGEDEHCNASGPRGFSAGRVGGGDSGEEAGKNLLRFYPFPASRWLSLRTTSAIVRLQLEFRRRVKTQGTLPGEIAALRLLFGLLASGQICLRRIKGFRDLEEKHGTAA